LGRWILPGLSEIPGNRIAAVTRGDGFVSGSPAGRMMTIGPTPGRASNGIRNGRTLGDELDTTSVRQVMIDLQITRSIISTLSNEVFRSLLNGSEVRSELIYRCARKTRGYLMAEV